MDQQSISFEIDSAALATVQGLNISANFAEMEAALTEMMEPYKSLQLTDMASAKSARAYVNKVKASIEDSRKLVKKLYQQPLAEFEARVKHLTAICDEASGAIDAQIKAEEQKEKDARIAELVSYFEESVGDLSEYITWDRIFNPRWATKSYGMANAQMEIDAAIEQTEANVDAIRAFQSPYETSLLLVLRETGDMGKVMQKKSACEALNAKKQERQRESPRMDAGRTEAPNHTETPPPTEKREIGQKTYCFTLEFEATKEQAHLISDFFTKNNIRYRKVR